MSNQKKPSYSAAFQERAVKLAVESDQAIAQTARDLGIKENTLYNWIASYHQGDSRTADDMNSEHLYEELNRLKRANATLREERESLTKAAASLAAHRQ